MLRMKDAIISKVSGLILSGVVGIAMLFPLLLGTTPVSETEAVLALSGTALALGASLGLEDQWMQSYSAEDPHADNVLPFRRTEKSGDSVGPSRKAA